MAVSITVKGLSKVQKKMNSMLREVKSSPESMNKIGLLGVRDVVDHFNQSQGPKNKWPALKYRSGKPLMDKGLLRTSTRFQVRPNLVKLFNNTKYGKYHQSGTKSIPQRKWMWISIPAIKKMTQTYLKIIMKAYK